MENIEGVENFSINIKPVMMKLKNGGKLSSDEKNQIVQFYLAVCNMIANYNEDSNLFA